MTGPTAPERLRETRPTRLPRVGFAGVGWIGRARLEALAERNLVEVAAVADPDADARRAAAGDDPDVARRETFEELLAEDLDGVVIATPSALHAAQARVALERGLAVFCQKPLGRTGPETAGVVQAAREADLLLGVDFSYRHVRAARAVREQVERGALGRVYAADLVFHNAYGPDKAWFYDATRSGGGCLVDLGIHLVDLALWMLGSPRVEHATARLFAGGLPWSGAGVEDHVEARLDLEGGVAVRLACSWRIPAGCDAVIGATFYGSEAAARLRNVDGSFYAFVGERLEGRSVTTLAEPDPSWGGGAIAAWAEKLAAGGGWDPAAADAVAVADALDRLYGRAP